MHNVSFMYNKQKSLPPLTVKGGTKVWAQIKIFVITLLQILGVLYSELFGTRIALA